MAAERVSGYPVKTHPRNLQYQAWIDLSVDDASVCGALLPAELSMSLRPHLSALHAYLAPAIYTFNYQGRPTLSGLRGYPAHAAIQSLNAWHQTHESLLQWMYGDVARGTGSD